MTQKWISGVLLSVLFFYTSFAQGAAPGYSPQSPPPASFVFAGPVTDVTEAGETTVRFKFSLVIHSLSPTKIEVVDAESGRVLVEAVAPALTESTLKHPDDPSIAVYEWTGYTAPEAVTADSPGWLHETGDDRVQLEVRVHSKDRPLFSFIQPATYSQAGKAAILATVKYNSEPKPQ